MRKLYASLFILLFTFVTASVTNAQVSGYAFSQSSGTFTPITGGTVVATASSNSGATALDDAIFNLPNGTIPFSFVYNGIGYTGLNISTNGFLTFGTTAPTGTTYTPISGTTAYDGAIAAFGGDLISLFNIASTTGEIRYEVLGTAPNRIFVVQWKNFRPSYTTSTTSAYVFDFQIRLNETTNAVNVVYGGNLGYLLGSTTYSGTRQIGLRGSANTDYNNRLNASTSLFTSSSAGIANSSTQAFNTVVATPGMPTSGLMYSWVPPSCAAPGGLAAAAVLPTTATVSWTSGGGANSYEWEIRTSGACGSGSPDQSGTTVSTSVNLSGLTPATTYTFCIRSVCTGPSNSAWTSFTFTTACNPVSILPWNENFDALATVGTTSFPSCWFKENGDWRSANNGSTTFDADARSIPNFIQNSWSAVNEFVWTPGFQLTAGTSYDFSFWFADYDGSTDWGAEVFYNTAQTSAGATQLGAPFLTAGGAAAPTSYTKVTRTFIPSSSGVYYFAIRINANFNPWYLNFDDFSMVVTPSCTTPTAITVGSISTSGASVSFTSAGNNFVVEYGAPGFTPGTGATAGTGGTVVTGTSSPIAITGLAPNTTYDVYVRQYCAIDLLYSANSTVSSFTTLCAATNVPYLQNFDGAVSPNFPSCLSLQDVNGATSWGMWYGGGTVVSSGSNSIRYQWNGATAADDWFYVQGLNLTAGTTYRLRFNYKASDGPTYIEKLEVKYGMGANAASMTAGTLFTNTNINTNVNSPFAQADVNFTPTSSGVYYIGFHCFSDADQAFLYIDDVNVTLVPTIDVAPTALVIPSISCPTNNIALQATIINNGLLPLDFSTNPVSVTAAITGAGTGTLTGGSPSTGILAPGASINIALAPNFDFAASGTYNFTVTTILAGDQEPANNVYTTTSVVLPAPAVPVVTPANPAVCVGGIQQLSVPASAATFASTTAVTIPSSGIASPYPSSISVNGMPATGVRVKSVTLNGLTHTFPGDIDIVLQSPTGTNVILMSDAGGGTDIVNGTLVFDDAAAGYLPATLVSGTYKPTNTAGPDDFPAPGPGSITQINPTLSGFTGDFNGGWKLFVVDDAGGDFGSMSGWSITFEVQTAVWTPVTGLFTDAAATIAYTGAPANVVYASPAATTTYSVMNNQGTCSAGPTSVTVTVNPNPTVSVGPNAQCGPVVLTATGTATAYTWSPAAGLSGTSGSSVTANPSLNTTYTVTGTITATGCSATATVSVNARPAAPVVAPTSATICLNTPTLFTVSSTTITSGNGASLEIPAGAPVNTASGPAGPYPSSIPVNGLPTSGVRVKAVNINGITHTWPSDIDMLLQAPNGTYVMLMSDAGGSVDIINGNLVFDDAAAGYVPATIVSGTYKPTNTAGPDNFPAPGPGSITQINPLLSDFTGNFNGDWKLFVMDDAGGDVGSMTSWSIVFEVNGAVWSPASGLFTDAAATVPYVAGSMASMIYANPTTTTTYALNTATATCTSPTTNVAVTVVQPITITTQPANRTVCQNASAVFSVVAGGNFQAYQWQVSTDGGTTWSNISGATGTSYTIASATTAMSGNRYRVIVSNSCTSVTSNAATLTVNALTTLAVSSLPAKICISDSLVPLSGSPVGGTWSGIGVSGFNFVPSATAVGTYTLTYSYTNTFGCTSTVTTSAKVEACPERERALNDNGVMIFPNPNTGQFNIRINSTLYNYLAMKVYSSSGQLIQTKTWGGLVYGRVVPVDITHLPAGVYMVRIIYDQGINGAFTTEKTFKVVVGH